MPLSKNVLSDSVWSFANSVTAIFKPFALVYLINNYLGTEAYGQIAVFLSSIALVSIISSLGVGFSMRRHISGDANINEKRRLFYFPINFQLIILLFCFLVVYYYISFYNSKISLTELGIYSFYYFSYILFQYFLEYRRWILNAKKFVTFSAMYTIIFLVSLLAAFQFDSVQNVYQILMLDALIMFAIFLYLFSTVYRELGISFGTFDRKGFIREFKLGMPYALGGLSEIAVSTTDRFMISYFFGLTEAGLYSSGYLFGSLSLIVVRLIGLFTPQYMFLARDSGDERAVNNLINYSFFAFFAISIPFVFFLILFGSEILSLVNISSDQALFSMIVISIASILSGSYLILSSVTIMEEKTAVQMKIMLAFSFFNILANYVFIKLFNSFAVASVATLATYILIVSIFILYLKKIWRFDFSVKFILVPLLLSIISYGFVNIFEAIFPSSISSSFVILAVLFSSLYLLGTITFLCHLKILSLKKIFTIK
jgi:O-antigen/teichoic acid export membrane protein